MAQVKVFVDDAVLGRLPQVCAKDGTATDAQLRVVHHVRQGQPSSLVWLLVFAGPLGWIALAFLLPGGTDERLTVEVPWSDASYDRLTEARRQRNRSAALCLFGATAVFLVIWSRGIGPGDLLLFVVVVAGAIAAQVAADRRFSRFSIGVDLDASRRWVTLRRVHPDFAAACEAQLSSRQPV